VENWVVAVGSILAIVLVLVSLAVVDARMLPAAPWARSVALSFGCAGTGILSWLLLAPMALPDVTESLFLPVAVLGGVASYLATIAVRSAGGGVVATLVFGLVWSLLVYVPTAIRTFSSFVPSWSTGVTTIDHGGSLPVNVAAGAAALGVLLCGGSRVTTATIRRTTGVIGVIGLCSGWLLWLAAAEFAVDEVSPSILVNGLVGAGGGVVGWIVVQRIRHRSVTLNSVAAGLISGLVAVTAGAPLFTPVSAVASGVIAGGVACLFTLDAVNRGRRQQWYVVGTHLIAGAVGVVALGLLATNMGFVFTGSVALIQGQIVGTLIIAAYSTAVSAGLWLLLRSLTAAVRSRRVTSAS
jgi:ammonium transporter, Amt family